MNLCDPADAATLRALHQENLRHLMDAVQRRPRSVESQRIFVLVLFEEAFSLGATQPLPRCA